jgi:hypothetical protein
MKKEHDCQALGKYMNPDTKRCNSKPIKNAAYCESLGKEYNPDSKMCHKKKIVKTQSDCQKLGKTLSNKGRCVKVKSVNTAESCALKNMNYNPHTTRCNLKRQSRALPEKVCHEIGGMISPGTKRCIQKPKSGFTYNPKSKKYIKECPNTHYRTSKNRCKKTKEQENKERREKRKQSRG